MGLRHVWGVARVALRMHADRAGCLQFGRGRDSVGRRFEKWVDWLGGGGMRVRLCPQRKNPNLAKIRELI